MGNDNTSNGFRALYYNIDGDYNTASGSFSLFFNRTGNQNIGIGHESLFTNTTGSYNIGIGSRTGSGNSTGSNNIYLGHSAGTPETGSNKLYIENSGANADNALIYGEFDTNILRTNSQFQIGNPTVTGYAFPLVDGTANQILQTNGSGNVSWIDGSTLGSDDHDWYEEGSTNAPNDINDDMFTHGNVAIGKTTADYALDIEEVIDSVAVRVKMINSSNTDNYGLYIENSSSGTGYHYGQYTLMEGTGTNGLWATYNRIENSGDGSHFGTFNSLGGDGLGWNYGTYNSTFGSGDGNQYGSYQILKQHGDGLHYGTFSTLYGNGNGDQIGSKNLLNATGTGDKYGMSNQLGGGTGTFYGVHNSIYGGGNGSNISSKYGVYNEFGNTSFNMDGALYGVYNSFDPTINGFGYSKYGVYTNIPVTVPGINYGIYCDVIRFDSYAGYFLGRVSIGTTTTNNYILPQSRGSANQIMQTNATGNVSWVNPSTVGTDNQNLTGATLTGNTLQLDIENGTSTSVDLSVLNSGGDITDITAGTGLIGGGTVGPVTLDITANNGLTANADDIVLGGTLNQTTTIIQDTFDMIFDLNSSGNFRIEGNYEPNLFYVDGGNDRIGILNNTPDFDIHLEQSNTFEAGSGGMGFSVGANNWKIYHSGAHFSFVENGTRRAYVTAGTGAYMPTSDRRLKKSITEVASILNKVNNLKAYRYLYKDQEISAKRTIGFMAQDVEPLFPELVGKMEDGYFALNYAGFGVIAVKAIQEQQELIVAQQKQIDALQKAETETTLLLSSLLKRIENLETQD